MFLRILLREEKIHLSWEKKRSRRILMVMALRNVSFIPIRLFSFRIMLLRAINRNKFPATWFQMLFCLLKLSGRSVIELRISIKRKNWPLGSQQWENFREGFFSHSTTFVQLVLGIIKISQEISPHHSFCHQDNSSTLSDLSQKRLLWSPSLVAQIEHHFFCFSKLVSLLCVYLSKPFLDLIQFT